MRRVPLGNTHYFKFTTRNFSTGAPYTLAGTPVISVYEENNLTQITTGVTLTVDYDSVTGLNSVAVAATSGNGYEVGKTYAAVVTTGTVNSVSVVGEVVDQFTVVPAENTTGYPLVDTAYLGGTSQTGRDIGASVLLSPGTGTGQISLTSGAVTTGTNNDKTGYSLTATTGLGNQTANITGNLSGSVGSVTGAVGSVTGNVGGNISGSVASVTAGVTLDATATSAQLVDDIWDETLTGATHNITDSAGKRIRDLQEYGTYSGGAIFIDTVNGTAGTTDYENGTFLFPVDSIADANTIATSLNLARFRVTPGSSITFAATQSGEVFHAHGSTIALGGQDISDTHIIGAIVSGTATATGSPTFDGCTIGTVNLPTSYIENSILNGTLTLGEAGNYNFVNSHGEGLTGCTMDFGAAIGNNTLTFCNWSGVLELQNMGQTGTDAAGIGGCGIITINANCTGGTLYLIGNFSVTDNSGGAVTIVYSDIETTANATLVDTNELQTDWTNGGRLDLILDAILAMLDDPRAEPGQGVPAVNADAMTKLDYLYKAWRNKIEQTSTTLSIYDDAGTTVDHKATVSDDGTTATKGEIGTGP